MEVTNGWKTVVGFSLVSREKRLQPFCQILCGWIQCPSDDFHCECSPTLGISVFGRKTSPDTEYHSFKTLPKCSLWVWFHRVVIGNFLIWNNYFRDKNAFKKINEWWSLMHWNHPGERRFCLVLLFHHFQVEREDGRFLNLIKINVL